MWNRSLPPLEFWCQIFWGLFQIGPWKISDQYMYHIKVLELIQIRILNEEDGVPIWGICRKNSLQSIIGSAVDRYADIYRHWPISVIGRYIGFTDNRKAYRYRLSVSADKEAHIGSLTDMKVTPFFSQNFIILAKETCEKFYFLLEYF